MKPRFHRCLPRTLVVCFGPMLLTQQLHAAEALFSSGALTSDATSGVSTSKTYTALANVVGGNVVVNGATFVGATTSGTGWSLSGIGNVFGSGGNKTTTFGSSAIDELFSGFQYGGNPGSITLSGLTAGQTYVTTLYCEDWAWPTPGTRRQTLTGTEGGSILFSEDALEASMLRYTFVATATTMTLKQVPFVPADTLHVYGLSNEQVFNKNWTSGADWTTAAWSTAGAPNSVGANANFTSQGAPTSINLDASQTVGHVQFDGSNAWTLGTGNASIFTLQTDAGGLAVLSTPTGSHVIAAPVELGSDAMKSGAGTLTLSAAVSGSKGMTITGGILRLGQANSYTGATTVNAGTILDLNDSVQTLTALNGAGTVLNNGTAATILTLNSGTFSGAITDHTTGSGTVSLTKTSSGTLTLTKASTYSGATIVNDGVLRLEGSGTPMITDNFTAAGTPDTGNLDFNLAGRQTGTAATQSWTKNGNMQVGNPTVVSQPVGTNGDYLLLASANSSNGAILGAMPLSSANITGPLKINFDMFKGNNTSGNWTSFAFRTTGSTTPAYPTAGAGEFGMLYRGNTGIQIFSNGLLADFASTTSGDAFAFYLTDNSGTGSPFDGHGTRVVVTQGGNIIGNFALGAGMTGSRNVAFGSTTGMVGGVDNLAVTPMQTDILPATTNLSLTTSTSVLQLENVTQTVAKFDGVAGSTVSAGIFSRLVVNGSTGSTFAGTITGVLGGITQAGSDTLSLTGTSTYGGTTVMAGGILNAASFSDYGVTGSLGNRTADSAGNVGLLFRGGTLQYTGSTAQSTNRNIRISTNGGATIDASGSDPSATLSFTAASSVDFFELPGNRSLTLTGSNTGQNTFGTAITQTGGLTSLTKNGTGTWVLTGASTYTGATAINGGVLALGSLGAISTGGDIVFGGGTLQYSAINTTDYSARIESGTSTGPVSIDTNGQDVTFATGFSSSKSGGLTKTGAGKLTLTGNNFYTGPTTISNGSLQLSTGSTLGDVDVAAGAGLEILSAVADQTLATDNATFAAGNLSLDLNSLGNPAVPLASTGTLTLNGNVAVSLANIGNLSNGSFSLIQYATRTGPGIFTQSSTSIGPRPSSSAVVSDTGSDIILTVVIDKPRWTGLDSGNWLAGPSGANNNWKLSIAGTSTDYIENDGVVFDDTATGTRTIDISAASVLPLSTVFDTAASNYKLTSSGGFGIAGSGPLFKNGSGTVVITTTNTYTGVTTINAGTLQLGDGTTDGSIAGTSAIINHGTLVYNNLTDKSVTAPVSGTGGIVKSGPGGLALSGANTYEGDTTLNAGMLTLGSPTALGTFGTLTINGGSLDSSVANLVLTSDNPQNWNADIAFLGTNSLNLGSGSVTLGGNRQINVTANTLTVGGTIDGTGFGLTKLGVGTLVLGGFNSYDGGTTLAAGTLRLGSSGALGDSGPIVFSGGILQYSAGVSTDCSARIASGTSTSPVVIDTNQQTVTFATALNSNQSGGLSVMGHVSSIDILELTASNSYGGQTLINTNATLRVGDNEVIPDNSVVAFSGNFTGGTGTAKLELQNFTETVAGLSGVVGIIQNRESGGIDTGTLIIDTAGQDHTFEGLIRNQSGTLALVKNGLGTQTITSTSITSNNNFSGGLTINGGTMKLRDAGNGRVISALSSNVTVASGATLALENTLVSNTSTTARIISGAGHVEISSGNVGTINLTGVNTYTGNTTVNGGTLNVAANSATTFADTSTVSIASGAVLSLPNAVTDTVASLVVGGSTLPPGLYDSSTPATIGFITGDGKLQVGASYAGWAATNTGGAAANVDTDLDGVANGVEFFMNAAAGFTANPSVVTAGAVRTVTWPNGGNIPSSEYGTQFKVQTSADLSIWTNILSGDTNLSNTGGSVIYTLPTGADEIFVRLVVTPN